MRSARVRAIFNRALFKYPEITDLETAARDLIECGQARGLRAEDYSTFVLCLPKTTLLDGARAAGFGRDIRTSWSKPVLADFFVAAIPFYLAKPLRRRRLHSARQHATDRFPAVSLFGKTADDLKNFALRHLGVLRTNRETSFSARFADADEAHACFHYSQVLDRIEVRSAGVFERAARGDSGRTPADDRILF